MKKNILIYALFTCFSFLALSDAAAQSEASRNKSRLNIGKKLTESTAYTFTKIPSTLDRSIKLRPSAAINAYYRSILLNPTTGNSTSVANKNRTIKETTAVAATEARPNLEDAAKY
jgi:hypothetical protein